MSTPSDAKTQGGDSLKGRTALVTGSTGGLGAAIAESLAAAGCNVVIHGLAEAEALEAQRREIEQRFGVRVLASGADLTAKGEIAAMFDAIFAAFGVLDIVVNNAVVRHFSPVENFAVERWEEALAVNLSAPFHLARLALPGMRRRDWGRIINLSSIYGQRGAANRIDYVTTKTGILGLTRAIAQEVAATHITCNALCPGTLPTPAIESRIRALAASRGISEDEATRDYLATRQPSRRFVTLESVAAMCVFLCSEAGGDINGADIPLDGGWSAG
jgi:3-hydroxybutyrate dehydrogenase